MTFTDTLITVLELRNLNGFLAGLGAAANASWNLTQSQNGLFMALQNGLVAMGNFILSNRLLVTALVAAGSALVAMTRFVDESVTAFGKLETQLLRTGLLFQNQGEATPLKELQAYADQLQDLTGVQNTEILAIMAHAKAIGFNLEQVKALTASVLNLKAAGLRGAGDSFLDTIQRQLEFPGMRSMRQLALQIKIDPTGLTGQIDHDVDLINQRIAQKYGDVAEMMRSSTEGVVNTVQSEWNRLLQIWGDAMAPVTNAFREFEVTFIGVLEQMSRAFFRFVQLFPVLFGNWGAGGIAGDQARLNAREVQQQQEADNHKNLFQIAQNTSLMAGALVTAVFGNQSGFTRAGSTLGQLNGALSR